MRKTDQYKKLAFLSAVVFVFLLLTFRACSALATAGRIPSFSFGRLDSVLAFLFFLPMLACLCFCGKYQTMRGRRRLGRNLTFVGGALLIFSMLQILLALLGVYG